MFLLHNEIFPHDFLILKKKLKNVQHIFTQKIEKSKFTHRETFSI